MSIVVVVGSANYDTTLRVPRHPNPGETILGWDMWERPGGKGANQAIAARRAGATVLLVAAVGDDDAGRACRTALRNAGVDLGATESMRDVPTGRAVIAVTDNGENTIVVIPGANARLNPEAVARAISPGTSVVLVQLEVTFDCAETALRRASEIGAISILNASPIVEGAHRLLPLADVVIVNEHEHELVGAPTAACVTRGEEGATWGTLTVAPPRVEVVDTTGAGDAFAGTLAARLALGDQPYDALLAAVTAGSIATTFLGAQAHTAVD